MTYEEECVGPLEEGVGVCAFRAVDADGDPWTLVATFDVEDDDMGRAMRSRHDVIRASAAVQLLAYARASAERAGFFLT
jgi:hypothetical protein